MRSGGPRLAFVIQRYGLEVLGGAETHCRWLAARLASGRDVEILTTCALDYVEWRNHYSPGTTLVDGIKVTRYPVKRPRSERRFALLSDVVFHDDHTLDEERQWVVENGPESPALVSAVRGRNDVDFFLFYCYRYYQTFFGLPAVAQRALLVPTAEEDPTIRLRVFRSLFRAPRGILYLSAEERSLVENVAGSGTPATVIGSGLEIAPGWEAIDVRSRFGLPPDYLLYVGRIDRNKGVDTLFADYCRLAELWREAPVLALVGKAVLPIPEHPRIRHLGVVSDDEKHALLAGSTVVLVPSPYESLSLIALEAWALACPVLASAACRVLEAQCVRSGAGLYYRGFGEFAAALRLLVENPELRRRLGESGRHFVKRECDWSVAGERATAFLAELDSMAGASVNGPLRATSERASGPT